MRVVPWDTRGLRESHRLGTLQPSSSRCNALLTCGDAGDHEPVLPVIRKPRAYDHTQDVTLDDDHKWLRLPVHASTVLLIVSVSFLLMKSAAAPRHASSLTPCAHRVSRRLHFVTPDVAACGFIHWVQPKCPALESLQQGTVTAWPSRLLGLTRGAPRATPGAASSIVGVPTVGGPSFILWTAFSLFCFCVWMFGYIRLTMGSEPPT